MRRQLRVRPHIHTAGGKRSFAAFSPVETFVLCNQTSVKPCKAASVRRVASQRETVWVSHDDRLFNTVTQLAACTGSRWTWRKWMNNVRHLITSWVLMIEPTRNSTTVWCRICKNERLNMIWGRPTNPKVSPGRIQHSRRRCTNTHQTFSPL